MNTKNIEKVPKKFKFGDKHQKLGKLPKMTSLKCHFEALRSPIFKISVLQYKLRMYSYENTG